METISIQEVTLADIHPLQSISKQTFIETFAGSNTKADMEKYISDSFSVAKLTSEIQNPGSQFYFAIMDDKVVGYMKLNTREAQTELKDKEALEIERIYVLHEYQGQKIGQILYNKALQIATQAQLSYVWLGVWEKNIKAISFYKKNGFTEFDKHIFRLGSDVQTDILMKQKIV